MLLPCYFSERGWRCNLASTARHASFPKARTGRALTAKSSAGWEGITSHSPGLPQRNLAIGRCGQRRSFFVRPSNLG
jgi:hypothetical protein